MFTNGIIGFEIQIADNVCVVGCGCTGLLMIQVVPKKNHRQYLASDIGTYLLEQLKN